MRTNQKVIRTLQDHGLTLALAESMTCGLIAGTLASAPGVSEVLMGSAVCYHETAKSCLLNVPPRLIKKHTAESQQVTDRMALELRRVLQADMYAAVTGLASPGGSETKTKPVGTVFFAVWFRNKLHRYRKQFRGSSIQIRRKTCDFLFREMVRLCNSTQ